MKHIGTDSLADVRLTLRWQDSNAGHTEVYNAYQLNFWRDILPRDLYHGLMGAAPGDRVDLSIEAGASLIGYNPRSVFTLKNQQFRMLSNNGQPLSARLGRFYPKGILRNVTGVFPQNVEPFRCVGLENGHLTVDFNHPLVERELSLIAEVEKVYPKTHERGGSSVDWVEAISSGPGMQSRWRQQPTDFFTPHAFERVDTTPDEKFYSRPRFVNHLDRTARKNITALYAELLPQKGHILDLMSSWVSHLPDDIRYDHLVGLGLNADELAKNDRLDEKLVHDLNQSPVLPFSDGYFNGVICTASIEYLIDPITVFNEIARVLSPGGVFIITFSNRWFDPKVIKIWPQLHEFERMGMVMEYFYRSGKFHGFNTLSQRGLPRDVEDKYYGQLPFADPVYAIWGQRL